MLPFLNTIWPDWQKACFLWHTLKHKSLERAMR